MTHTMLTFLARAQSEANRFKPKHQSTLSRPETLGKPKFIGLTYLAADARADVKGSKRAYVHLEARRKQW